MPVLLRQDGYRFLFYSDEGDPLEPVHIHVRKDNREVKFWLYPFVSVAKSKRMPTREQAALARVVQQHRAEFQRRWHEHFRTQIRSV